jgi:16S rRNA (cytosine1402-N4)-methyltransferase
LEKTVGRFYRGKKIHFATKTFQALRIATNRELENLDEVIEKGFHCLSKGGRIAIITFHSLEDRLVKRKFKDLVEQGQAELVNKKPIIPNELETEENPRSRSAKLRLIEKII